MILELMSVFSEKLKYSLVNLMIQEILVILLIYNV